MSRMNKEDVEELIGGAQELNEQVIRNINALTRQDAEFKQLAGARRMAERTSNHDAILELDAQLLSAMKSIDALENQIKEYFVKNINFDVEKDQGKREFMLEENEDKAMEIEIMKALKDGSYVNINNGLRDQQNKLHIQLDNLQNELYELESSPNPNNNLIQSKKIEIEEVQNRITEIQKQLEKLYEVRERCIRENIKTKDMDNEIKKNNRVIENNLRNLSFNDISPELYQPATSFIRDSYNLQMNSRGMLPMEARYKGFEEIFSPEEFRYIDQEYQRSKGDQLTLANNAKTGFFYNLFHKGDMEDLIIARYPHLALKENKKELQDEYKRTKEALAVMLQSGVTSDMLRNVYRNISLDIRYYEGNIDKRKEWLESLMINQPGKENPEQQRTIDNEKRVVDNEQPDVDNEKRVVDNEQQNQESTKTEQAKKVMKGQTTLDQFNDPIDVLFGIERLGLPDDVVKALKNSQMPINNINDLMEELNRRGFDLTANDRQKQVNNKKRIDPEQEAKEAEENNRLYWKHIQEKHQKWDEEENLQSNSKDADDNAIDIGDNSKDADDILKDNPARNVLISQIGLNSKTFKSIINNYGNGKKDMTTEDLARLFNENGGKLNGVGAVSITIIQNYFAQNNIPCNIEPKDSKRKKEPKNPDKTNDTEETQPVQTPEDKEDPNKKDPDKKDPNKKDPNKKDPDKKDPDKKDPNKKDPDKKDPNKKDPDKKDPDKKDPDKTSGMTKEEFKKANKMVRKRIEEKKKEDNDDNGDKEDNNKGENDSKKPETSDKQPPKKKSKKEVVKAEENVFVQADGDGLQIGTRVDKIMIGTIIKADGKQKTFLEGLKVEVPVEDVKKNTSTNKGKSKPKKQEPEEPGL